MERNSKILACLLLLVSCLSIVPFVRAAYGPQAYVTENVTQNYWANGTAKGSDVRNGMVEVSVPNNWDVLQYVRINFSSSTFVGNLSLNYTDLANSTTYSNTITSYPNANTRSAMYVNISGSAQASRYNITNTSIAPTINLSLTTVNYYGGSDIFDSDNIGPGGTTNTLVFNLTIRNPSTVKNITNVNVGIQFDRGVGPTGRDAVNISLGTNVTTGIGFTYIVENGGSATDYDRINWTGYLVPGSQIYIVFNATFLEGASGNLDNGVNSINLDSSSSEKGVMGNYSNSTSTHTYVTINYKFSRGPVREGVDLQLSNGMWYARGLIKNIANASLDTGNYPLTYNISQWAIYSVKPSTGEPFPTANLTGYLNQSGGSELTPATGTIYTNDLTRSSNTSWWNTSSTSKPYIAAYFNWSVEWNDTTSEYYYSYINTTLDMPTLNKIDQSDTKSISGVIYPDTGNQVITITDTANYLGSGSISVGNIALYSVVPVNTTSPAFHGIFGIDSTSIKAYFYNSSGTCSGGCQLAGDSNVNWTSVNATYYANNGTILVTIKDLSSALIAGGGGSKIGRNLSAAGDNIVVTYNLVSNSSMTTGDVYAFTGNTSFTSTSGTAEAESNTGATITVSSQRMIGYKDLYVQYPNLPTRVNVTINVTVQAATGGYITGIKFIDYVINQTFGLGANNLSNYIYNLTVKFNGGAWANGTNYNVTFNGTRTLADGTTVQVYEIINATSIDGTGGFNLTAGQYITVDYWMDVGTSGSYVLPVQIAAFDPSTGEYSTTEFWGAVRVDVPETAVPMQITDHALELAKRVVVGTPAAWIKNFEVYNPNGRPVPGSFQTTIFGDAMQGFVSYYDDNGNKIDEPVTFGNVENGQKTMSWSTTLNPLETRTYEVRILTPPVMEIDRDVEVLDKLENKMVKLKMDVYLKSFAAEPYQNVVLNLPVDYENVVDVKDGFGKLMEFTGSKDSTSIIVDQIDANGLKTISMTYAAKYPAIIITPDRDRYDLNGPVSLDILVINGGENIDYPYVEVEIYTPGMDVIYSNLEKLKNMEPLEKTDTYQKFVVPANAPGGMYVASARYRQDFNVLASTTGNFFVVGPAGTPQAVQIIIVFSVAASLAYVSMKRLKEARKGSDLGITFAPA